MTPDELRKLADEATSGQWAVADIPNGQSVRIPLDGYDSFRFFTYTSENARLIALAPALARSCAELGKALERVKAQQPKTLLMIEANGFVFDSIGKEPGNWQHLAFSIYADLCEVDSTASAALAELSELAA